MTIVSLPDFEDMFKISQEIKNKSIELGVLSLELDIKKADLNRKATTDSKFFVGGKTPSQDYLKSSLFITGEDNELIPLREKKNILSAEIEELERHYEILKIIVDVWRTQSANERNAL